jgi:hypothetical protein
LKELSRENEGLHSPWEWQENGVVSRRKRIYLQVTITGASNTTPIVTAIAEMSEYELEQIRAKVNGISDCP